MKNEELPVYLKCFNLVEAFDIAIESFTREYKDSHGVELRRQGVELLSTLCLANFANSNPLKRHEYLEKALGLYESYKVMKRLVHRRKCISDKQAAVLDELLGEIGKQIMGWKLSVDKSIVKTE